MARKKSNKGGEHSLFPAHLKKSKDEKVVHSQDKPEQRPERLEETQMQPEQMGDIHTPDRSGVNGIHDRGR